VLARATSVKEALQQLTAGTELWKVRDKGGLRGFRWYKRKYRLDLKHLEVKYSPHKGASKKVDPANCVKGSGPEYGISLDDMCEIRVGHGTDTFNGVTKNIRKDGLANVDVGSGKKLNITRQHCFSIIFKGNTRPLDLVSDDVATAKLWVDVLNHLLATIRSLGQQREYELYLKKQFQQADKNKNGSLTFEECLGLTEQLNIQMDKKNLLEFFQAANKNKAKKGEKEALDESEFISFYYSLLRRPELDEIFIKYICKKRHDGDDKSNGDGTVWNNEEKDMMMTAEVLADFLSTEQKIEMTTEECQEFINAFEPRAGKSTLSLEGFTQFMMFSEFQDIRNVKCRKIIYQDMERPLSHYWIASSHNTYLLGNQVSGESSVDAYINVLKQGCKCVELDCWDGGDSYGEEPIIYHGWTMTSKILFKDVMQDAIKQYAFFKSNYPLILSIENHCSIEYQDKMAHHLETILGDMLYKEPVDENLTQLPSPEDLKGKILIKAKKLPPGLEEGQNEVEDCLESDHDEDDESDEKRRKVSKVGKF